jgi:hypothetical protein
MRCRRARTNLGPQRLRIALCHVDTLARGIHRINFDGGCFLSASSRFAAQSWRSAFATAADFGEKGAPFGARIRSPQKQPFLNARMTNNKSVSERIRRYAASGQAMIARQQRMVDALEASADQTVLALARRRLAAMQEAQRLVEAHVARVEQAQQESVRYAGSDEIRSPSQPDFGEALAVMVGELRADAALAHSMNDELARTNAQLQAVNIALQAQLQILQDSVTMVGLDEKLCIVLATPSVNRLFTIGDGDTGRGIATFMQKFADPQFVDTVRTVMRTREHVERTARAAGDVRWLVQIRPAVFGQQRAAGAVVIFTNVTGWLGTSIAVSHGE